MRNPAEAERVAALRRWAVLLDSYFRVPGTNIRFGLDAILGLVPGLGDIPTPVFAGVLMLHGIRMRLPVVVQVRMLLNALLDMLIGAVPVLGDLVDVGWKANVRNLALLERHARPGVPPRRADYVFVWIFIAVLAAITVTPIVVLAWLLATRPII